MCLCDLSSSSVQPSRWALFPLFYRQGDGLGKFSGFPRPPLLCRRRTPGPRAGLAPCKARLHSWEPGELGAGAQVAHVIQVHFEKLPVGLGCFPEARALETGPGEVIAMHLLRACGSFSL